MLKLTWKKNINKLSNIDRLKKKDEGHDLIKDNDDININILKITKSSFIYLKI
jgi:hypothetical protein